MIEKLDLEKRKSFGLLDWFARNGEPSGAGLVGSKINELVDAVNSLRDDCNLLMGYIAPEDSSHPTVAKNASVTESGQEEHNWIGCLCELWSGNSKNHRYGILKGIAKNTYKGHKTIHKYQALSMSFEHCEPVKPDDDIIYKKD